MTLPKGWINRQVTRVERDSKTWPTWMQRETKLREQEQASSTNVKPDTAKEASAPLYKKVGET